MMLSKEQIIDGLNRLMDEYIKNPSVYYTREESAKMHELNLAPSYGERLFNEMIEILGVN